LFHVKLRNHARSSRHGAILATVPHRGTSVTRGWAIGYIGVVLAVVAGVLHAALAPIIVIGGVKPNLVLAAAVVVTSRLGLMPGSAWAFVAGLTANLLGPQPLGSVPLTLLLVTALTAALARLAARVRWLHVVASAVVGSIVAEVLSPLVARILGQPVHGAVPATLILTAALVNAALAVLIAAPGRLWVAARTPEERSAW
jgi:cell shape-determining protein MreD